MRRPHRTWPQRLLLTLTSVLTVVCLVAAAGIAYAYNQASSLPRIDVGAALSPPAASGEPQNILLVGIDNGAGLSAGDPVLRGRTQSLNTDTIMILRVDPKSTKASLLSLPRDLYVDLAGGGQGRINTALALGGPERLIDTIKQDFGIPINHYAMVDFQGFESLVSAVDGVPIYFRYPSRDQATGLFQYNPGCVNLDGEQALAYARSRHFEIQRTPGGPWVQDPSSDIGRIARQQQFIKAALRKAVQKGVRNPFVLKDLLGVAQRNVTLDTQLSIQDLVDLGTQFRNFDPDTLTTYTPPATGMWVGQMAVLQLDTAGAQPMFDIFRGTAPMEGAGGTTSTTAAGGGSSTTLGSTSTTASTVHPTTSTTVDDFLPTPPPGVTCG